MNGNCPIGGESSLPPNPLFSYRSHSVNDVLVAANTMLAQAMAKNGDVRLYQFTQKKNEAGNTALYLETTEMRGLETKMSGLESGKDE